MKSPEERIQELERKNQEQRKKIDAQEGAWLGTAVLGLVLGLAVYHFGASKVGVAPVKSKIEERISEKPVNTIVERAEKEGLIMIGTMTCSGHDPKHAAASHSDRKELTKEHGCKDWTFSGVLSNEAGGKFIASPGG